MLHSVFAAAETSTLAKHARYEFNELYPSVRNFIRWKRTQIESAGLHLPVTAIQDAFSDLTKLVITATEIDRFEQQTLGVTQAAPAPQSEEKPMSSRERRSAQQIIAVLAAMAEVEITTPYKAASVLRAAAAKYGLEIPSDETIKKFLQE